MQWKAYVKAKRMVNFFFQSELFLHQESSGTSFFFPPATGVFPRLVSLSTVYGLRYRLSSSLQAISKWSIKNSAFIFFPSCNRRQQTAQQKARWKRLQSQTSEERQLYSSAHLCFLLFHKLQETTPNSSK